MNATDVSMNERILRRAALLAVGTVLAACSASNDGDRSASPEEAPVVGAGTGTPAKAPLLAAWHETIAKAPRPHDGCFRASYPSTQWTEVPCAPPPSSAVSSSIPPTLNVDPKSTEASPRGGERAPLVVGAGTDWFAQAPGTLTQATGFFPQVTGATGTKAYSVQMNSNLFPMASSNPLCANVPTCNGWQQVVYSTVTAQTGLYFQYWLIGRSSCPTGWSRSGGNCFLNSNSVQGVPLVATDDLSSMRVTAQAGSSDVVTMTIEGQAYSASFSSVLGLSNAWNVVAFGVYGDLGSAGVTLSPNTTIVTQIDTAPSAASCSPSANWWTTETNSLTKVPNCCVAVGGATPGITFMESNAASPTCSLCGTTGGPCCFGNTCAASTNTCQLGTCEATSTLTASPNTVIVSAGDGVGQANYATLNLEAAGYWTTLGSLGTNILFDATSVPAGATLPPSGTMPAGMTWTITNDTSPPTIKVTAAADTPPGDYVFAIRGTIDSLQNFANLTVQVNGCQPVTCSAAHWACGSFDDGCGGTSSCGSCPSGESCTSGACYACTATYCPAPEFFNYTTCKCQGCPCGTIISGGKHICEVCKP